MCCIKILSKGATEAQMELNLSRGTQVSQNFRMYDFTSSFDIDSWCCKDIFKDESKRPFFKGLRKDHVA